MNRIWLVLVLGFLTLCPGGIQAQEVDDREIITALIDGLKDADPEVRVNLASTLALMGGKVVPDLIQALELGSPAQRAGAAYALSQMRANAKPAIPSLLRAIKDPDETVRRQASYAIHRILSTRTPAITARDIERGPLPREGSANKPRPLPALDPPPR